MSTEQNGPSYSGRTLRQLVNAQAAELGLTWEDNPDLMAELADAIAADLDALGPLARLVPTR